MFSMKAHDSFISNEDTFARLTFKIREWCLSFLDVYLHAPDVCQSLVFGINESSDVR